MSAGNTKLIDFCIDDFIRAKAYYAECLMLQGHFKEAISSLQKTKQIIENEIIFENRLLYVDVCYWLASCYFKKNLLKKSLEIFEFALNTINQIEKESDMANNNDFGVRK